MGSVAGHSLRFPQCLATAELLLNPCREAERHTSSATGSSTLLPLSLALSFSLCLRQQQHSGLHSALSPPLLSRCPSGARLNDMAIHFVAQQESLARLPRRRLWALPLTDRPRPGQGRTFISGGGARRGEGGCTGGTARCSCYAFINCFIII